MKDFLKLALSFCRQSIQERFAGSILGALWVFIWPIVQLLIYIIIFGKLMGSRLGVSGQAYSYGIYLAAGLLAWTCFANTLQRSSRVFVEKRNIIGKIAVDLRIFPLSICFEELYTFIIGFCLLFIVDLWLGWRPDFFLFSAVLAALYVQQVMALGLGLFFGCCAVFSRDIMELVAIIMQIAFWFTPIVYLPSILPDWVLNILWINPMVVIVDIFQKFFVMGGAINWQQAAYSAIFAHLSLALGLYALHRWKKDILDVL